VKANPIKPIRPADLDDFDGRIDDTRYAVRDTPYVIRRT
jgi:hypothetical protein